MDSNPLTENEKEALSYPEAFSEFAVSLSRMDDFLFERYPQHQ